MLPLLLGLLASSFPDPWGAVGELDVEVISHGESVDFREHLAEEKFTVVDIGAPWCSPCHAAAHELRAYMQDHADVAIRVVDLGEDPWESWSQPIVREELGLRPSVPYFVLYAPSGRELYRGHRVDRVVKIIERRRD